MAYTYPDKNDRLTCQLVNEYDGRYWQESEERVLKLALEAICKLKSEREKSSAVRMLDLGCGMGRLFEVFIPYVDEITAAEPDAERFAGAQTAGKAASLKYDKPVTVIQGDAAAVIRVCGGFGESALGGSCGGGFGMDDGSTEFDIVLSSHVLQHVPTWTARQLMETMSNFVEPGGLLFITTTYTDGDEDAFSCEGWRDGKRLSEVTDKAGFNRACSEEGVLPVRMFAEETIIGMAEETGFDLHLKTRYHYMGHTSAEEDYRADSEGEGRMARDAMYIFIRRND